MNTALLTKLRDALEDAETDAAVRAIVITGSGEKALCAGADITELVEKSPEDTIYICLFTRKMSRSIWAISCGLPYC
ncbi:MAG: enoyl-CoA hydratase/isomerase family protein [Methanophagales archaeon]|nr:enoyl-CoA hydratase/isomerase family protein [Methanophagales archaeon]